MKIDDKVLTACALAIHKGLGGNGWAYSNYGYNELESRKNELKDAAQACLTAYLKETQGQPTEPCGGFICDKWKCECHEHEADLITSIEQQEK